jgi:predicted nucleic acid-binding protein
MPTASSAAPAERTFVDTNVLVYAHDSREREKQPRARAALEELWTTGGGVLSTQVLQEFYVVTTGKQSIGMPPSEAREIVALYSTWRVVVVDPVLILAATQLHERRSISFWDALIVEAARQAGAGRILTEDLSDGDDFDGVHIVNPFRMHS